VREPLTERAEHRKPFPKCYSSESIPYGLFLTNSMSPSWEADNPTADQEISRLLWNTKIHVGFEVLTAVSTKKAVFWVVAPWVPLIALIMEAARTSETLEIFYPTTRRYNPEDSHLRRFITVFTRACHWFLSWARWIQSAPYFKIHFNIILPCTPWSNKLFFPFTFSEWPKNA
jgi:hypothetical protein